MIRFTICLIVSLSSLTAFSTELSPQQARNLTAFTHIYGLVKYFHPSQEAFNINWQALAVNGSKSMLAVENDAKLIQSLDSIFSPIAPTMQIRVKGNLPTHTYDTNTTYQYWNHKGLNMEHKKSVYYSIVKESKVNEIPVHAFDFSKPYQSEIVPGIEVSLPILVEASKKKLFTTSNQTHNETPLTNATSIAGVVITWNELQFFYPYWDVVNTDWDSVLLEALQQAFLVKTETEYREVINSMVIQLQDGHGYVDTKNSDEFWRSVPVWANLVEEKLIIQSCANCSELGVTLGDEILQIGNQASLELYQQKYSNKSGSHQFKKRFAINSLLYTDSKADSIQLVFKNSQGATYSRTFQLLDDVWNMKPHRFEKIQEVEPGVYYVNIDRIQDKEFKKTLPQLKQAKGIIFELKQYPTDGLSILQYLTQTEVQSARWNIPIVTYPHQRIITDFNTSGRWSLKPKKPYLGDKKIVFIVSGRAISYAETYLGIVEHYKLGSIVGEEPTAGANGNVNFVELPNNLSIMYTGMKVLKHDGSQHHLIGITPTHTVSITQEAVRENRDELFEKALEIIRKQE